MRRATLAISIISLLLLGAAPAYAQMQQKDWYDESGLYLVHELDHHFYEARVAFLEKKNGAAADEIRRGAAYVKLEADRSIESQKKNLLSSYSQLEKLADEVEIGKVDSSKKLDMAFAGAQHALAANGYLQATNSWKSKDAEGTIHYLQVAAAHLERAMIWPGYKREQYVSEVTQEVDRIAEKLKGEKKVASEEVDKTLRAVGQEIDNLGKEIEPPAKRGT
jgi:type II secretory pathway component PulJ